MDITNSNLFIFIFFSFFYYIYIYFFEESEFDLPTIPMEDVLLPLYHARGVGMVEMTRLS